MTVFIGFMIAVFLLSARREARGRSFSLFWLALITFVVAVSFYSLRVVS